jgi:hypothetical protein
MTCEGFSVPGEKDECAESILHACSDSRAAHTGGRSLDTVLRWGTTPLAERAAHLRER